MIPVAGIFMIRQEKNMKQLLSKVKVKLSFGHKAVISSLTKVNTE